MKHLKRLGLAAVAAMVLMGFVGVGSASATVLFSGATKLGAGAEISASLVNNAKGEQTAVSETLEGTILDTCTGITLRGKTSNTGGTTETIRIPLEELTWAGCTKNNRHSQCRGTGNPLDLRDEKRHTHME